VRTGEVDVRAVLADSTETCDSDEESRDSVGFALSPSFAEALLVVGPSDLMFMMSARCLCSASRSSRIRRA
jgi:hypothetical protein